jgi:hypothetical protein
VNPFAAADMVNAQRAPERPAAPRKPEVSLFERITGVRRAEKRQPEAEPKMDVRSEPGSVSLNPAQAAPAAAAPVAAAPMPAPVAAPPAEPAQPALWAHESAPAPVREAPQASSSLLGGMDPDDRLPISAETDDPLDIPAFLRRQAN